jgi:hypothetical protein
MKNGEFSLTGMLVNFNYFYHWIFIIISKNFWLYFKLIIFCCFPLDSYSKNLFAQNSKTAEPILSWKISNIKLDGLKRLKMRKLHLLMNIFLDWASLLVDMLIIQLDQVWAFFCRMSSNTLILILEESKSFAHSPLYYILKMWLISYQSHW